MFADSPQLVAYLSRTGLALYDRRRDVAKADLPTDLVENLEVRDAGRLEELWSKFLEGAGVRGQRLLIVLGDSVVFQRTVDRVNASQDQTNRESFKAMLPFEPEQRGLVGVTTHEQLVLFGANRDLYNRLYTAAERAGARIMAVVPAMAYGVQEPAGQLTPTNLTRFFSHKRLREQADFLQGA